MKRVPGVLLALFVLSVRLSGKEPDKNKGFFLEFSAAYSNLNPRDLNALAEARQGYFDLSFRTQREYLHQIYGNAFAYSMEETTGSGLKQIRNGFPLNLRIGYRPGPRISLYAGVQLIHRAQESYLQQTYEIEDSRPDQVNTSSYTQEAGYPDFMLAVRAWIPQVGIRLDLIEGPAWSGGVWLAAGPMFASIRAIEEYYSKTSYSDGYWNEYSQIYDMKGAGTGFDIEGGIRILYSLNSRLSVSLEGGYAWRRAGGFHGPGHYEAQSRDSNAAENCTIYDWEGSWYILKYKYAQLWGELTYSVPGNYFNSSSNTDSFLLDLSGLQLAVGLVFFL